MKGKIRKQTNMSCINIVVCFPAIPFDKLSVIYIKPNEGALKGNIKMKKILYSNEQLESRKEINKAITHCLSVYS